MEFIGLILKIIFGSLLLGLGIEDIKRKEVSVSLIVVLYFIGVLLFIYYKNTDILQLIGGILAGVLVIAAGVWSKGKIGSGDGFIMLAIGIAFGFTKFLFIFALSLFLAAFYSAVIIVRKKGSFKSTIPFVPFIFLGYWGVNL